MRPSDQRPAFWIIGGPNGSGKTTAYSRTDTEGLGSAFWIVNPDLLTVRLRDAEGLALADANLAAVRRLEQWLEATIRVHQSVGVETVLSTEKYRRLVVLARDLGFRFRLVYVMLASPELNVQRVRDRVLKGGHDVPADKIIDRYGRSLQQLPWFLDQADDAQIFDNSGVEPRPVLRKTGGSVTVVEDAPANLLKALNISQKT